MNLQNYNQNPDQQGSQAEDANGQNTYSTNAKGNGNQDAERPDRKKYVYFIEKQKFETDQENLQVREILQRANVDSNTKTLAVKQQGGFHEYKDLNEIITLGSALHFVLFDNQPNTVS